MDHSTPTAAVSLLPAELAGHTVESLYALHGPERKWTYWFVLGGVVGALASLPVIHVDVSVRAPGIVRSLTERAELKTAVSGRIGDVPVHDNDVVAAGQVLLTLGTGELDEQVHRQAALMAEKAAVQADLRSLLAEVELAQDLQTVALAHEQIQYRAQLESYRLAEAKAASEYGRFTALADKGIATRQELDNSRYEVERLQAESRLLREQTRARWAARLKDEESGCADLASTLRQLEEQRTHYTVRAPVAGVLVGFNGWSPGGQVLAGQVLGTVSPGDALRVETQVSTKDIGLVRTGQRVRLQVDAYPYTQWGMLDGVVESIGGDLLAGGAPGSPRYFKVLVRPVATHLSLSSGTRAELKRGLTLTARYVLARRSLLQVLYDDASAWLNPQDNRTPL